MKKIFFLFTLAFILLATPNSLFSQNEEKRLAIIDSKTKENTSLSPKIISNEREVLFQVIDYLNKNLQVPIELADYYNAPIKVTASFRISKSGKLEDICTNKNSKDPIIAAIIAQLSKLDQVPPVTVNGEAVSRNYFVPIMLKTH